MQIGIIGAGNMGAGLGKLWAEARHQVVFSYSRDEEKLRELAASAGTRATAGTIQEAAAQEVVLLTVWLPAVAEVIQAAGSLERKIVITCVSGLQPDFTITALRQKKFPSYFNPGQGGSDDFIPKFSNATF